ncbi:MAG TPA: transcriptional repressor [Firmicutes bacterium]|nr:transcriptional repressor [Bacillota bacterium]
MQDPKGAKPDERPAPGKPEKTRNTRQKQLILALLEEAGGPLTAGEIYARAVRRQPSLAKSTVYRNLEAMQARGEVVRGRLESGESFYGAAHGQGHRHYMICKGCNRMFALPACPLASMERDIEEAEGFAVTDHVIQIYGYCADCRRREGGPSAPPAPEGRGT